MKKEINLSGVWRCREFDVPFTVPGSACESNIGEKTQLPQEMTKETVRSLLQHHRYRGELTLEREYDTGGIDPELELYLYMERVSLKSELFIDGEKCGREKLSFSLPHIYKIPRGKHTLAVKIDNSDILNIGNMSSGYSEDTCGFWNGIAGRVCICAVPKCRIERADIYPELESGRVKIKFLIICPHHDPMSHTTARLEYGFDGMHTVSEDIDIYTNKSYITRYYDLSGESYTLWSEFSPALYTLRSAVVYNGVKSEHTAVTGFRALKSENGRFFLNSSPISLRGTVDCGIFPETGYPPTDKAHWLKVMGTVKEYGLNHVRFHSWCPPHAAFEAADEIGVYLQIEMPLWLNHDVSELSFGDDGCHEMFFRNEAVGIMREYGNHPSFMLFSNGNEIMGDFAALEDNITMLKALDPRHLYTLTSNFDRIPTEADDFFLAFNCGGTRIRTQGREDETAEGTFLNYSDAVNRTDIPIMSFETGQFSVYPDVREMTHYNGVMLPTNIYAVRRDMEKRGIVNRCGEYVRASGELAALMYKDEIEAVLRTEGMGGTQLLALTDYPGQCLATVGLLNVFWESKGIIEPERFREFCSPRVPLMKAKRIFCAGDVFEAELMLYDFSEKPLTAPEYTLTFLDGNKEVCSVKTGESKVSVKLDFIRKSTALKAELSVEGAKNSWDIYVFENSAAQDMKVFEYPDEAFEKACEAGGRVMLRSTAPDENSRIKGGFLPVFWSPAYFPSKNPSGIIVNDTEILDGFPSGRYTGYQWKRLLEDSYFSDISSMGEHFEPIIDAVPNFFDNTRMSPLFVYVHKKAEVLVCGFDLDADYPEARALKAALYRNWYKK